MIYYPKFQYIPVKDTDERE